MIGTILTVIVFVVIFSFVFTGVKAVIMGNSESKAHLEEIESRLDNWEKVHSKISPVKKDYLLHIGDVNDKLAGCRIYIEKPSEINNHVFIHGLIGLFKIDPTGSDYAKKFGQYEEYLVELRQKHGSVADGIIIALENYLGK